MHSYRVHFGGAILYAYRIIQDIQDKEQALLRAVAGMGSTAAFDLVNMRMKSLEEIAADELVKIRSERIEREAEQDATKAYAQARERGIARAGAPSRIAAAGVAPRAHRSLSKRMEAPDIKEVRGFAQEIISDGLGSVGSGQHGLNLHHLAQVQPVQHQSEREYSCLKF